MAEVEHPRADEVRHFVAGDGERAGQGVDGHGDQVAAERQPGGEERLQGHSRVTELQVAGQDFEVEGLDYFFRHDHISWGRVRGV